MTNDEVMRKALEALEYMHAEKCDYMIRNKLGDPSRETATKLAVAAIAGLRNALSARPEPQAAVSDAEIIRIACETQTAESGRDGYVLPISFARAVLAASRQVPAGWQPISTAPKDGRTLLLGYLNSNGKWRTLRGQWFSAGVIEETWEDTECAEGWYETSVECEDDVNCWATEPTHWMPLPALPAGEPRQEEGPKFDPRLGEACNRQGEAKPAAHGVETGEAQSTTDQQIERARARLAQLTDRERAQLVLQGSDPYASAPGVMEGGK